MDPEAEFLLGNIFLDFKPSLKAPIQLVWWQVHLIQTLNRDDETSQRVEVKLLLGIKRAEMPKNCLEDLGLKSWSPLAFSFYYKAMSTI